MPEPLRPTDEALISSFGRLVVTHRHLERRLGRDLERSCGITLTRLEVLLRLSSAPRGELTMGELARAMNLTSGGATRVVDRMIAAGEVERRPCADDRRVLYARLTEAGRSRAREAAAAHAASLRAAYAALSDAELASLDRFLDRLRGRALDPPGT